jgi:Fibronectin type III domain
MKRSLLLFALSLLLLPELYSAPDCTDTTNKICTNINTPDDFDQALSQIGASTPSGTNGSGWTLNLSAGTFVWTRQSNIYKPITIKGGTVMTMGTPGDPNTLTANATASQTIVQDSVLANGKRANAKPFSVDIDTDVCTWMSQPPSTATKPIMEINGITFVPEPPHSYTGIHTTINSKIITAPAGTFKQSDVFNYNVVGGSINILVSGASKTVLPIPNNTTIASLAPNTDGSTATLAAACIASTDDAIGGPTTIGTTLTQLGGGGEGGLIYFSATGAKRNYGFRASNLWIKAVAQGKPFGVHGWTCGVLDHCRFEVKGGQNTFPVEEQYGGKNKMFGNGSYADYPYWGTDRFWFIEDCAFYALGVAQGGTVAGNITDSNNGGRWVLRHNYFKDSVIGTHGQEGGASRGDRGYEAYNNKFDMTLDTAGGNLRSGIGIVHDNTYVGTRQRNDFHTNMNIYRLDSARGQPIWGGGDGTSPWDRNAGSDGRPVPPGQSGFKFYPTGSIIAKATRDGTVTSKEGTLYDDNANWQRDQWVNYSVTNKNPASALGGLKCQSVRVGSYNLWGNILRNDQHTITYAYYASCDGGQLVFGTGDDYEIHRVLRVFGQPALGKGEELVNDASGQNPRWLNVPAGETGPIVRWPNPNTEPCVGWNNVHTPSNTQYGFNTGGITGGGFTYTKGDPAKTSGSTLASPPCDSPSLPTCIGDFYDLGSQSPTNAKNIMRNIYTLERNGVPYGDNNTALDGTYVYPHPLVSGATPTPPPTPTPAPSPPSAPSATPASSQSIVFSWTDNAPNETGFKVQSSSTSATAGFAERGTTGAVTGTGGTGSFTDTGLTASTQYWYRVRATNGGGDSGFTSVATATTLPLEANVPASPSSLNATANPISITLNWTDNSNNEIGFNVERTTTPTVSSSWLGIAQPTAPPYTDNDVNLCVTYSYRVNAYNSVGPSSSYTNTVSASPTNPCPTATPTPTPANIIIRP